MIAVSVTMIRPQLSLFSTALTARGSRVTPVAMMKTEGELVDRMTKTRLILRHLIEVSDPPTAAKTGTKLSTPLVGA